MYWPNISHSSLKHCAMYWPNISHSSLKHCAVQHGVLYSTVCCTIRCVVQHGVLYITMCCTVRCAVQYGVAVQYDVLYSTRIGMSSLVGARVCVYRNMKETSKIKN